MAGRRTTRRQRGAALLIFLILVVVGALTYLVNSLTPEEMNARRERQTQEALAQAREALLGYAMQYRDRQIATGQLDHVYGFLPLPDLGTSRNNNTGCAFEGCDAANFFGNALNISAIGRFPWRALGTEPLRDGYGECLWYVVSGSHQRIQRGAPVNWDTLSQLDIVVANGTSNLVGALASSHDRPVVVIFAPGAVLPGQTRTASLVDTVATCGGNYDAINYLDPAVAGTLGTTSNYFGGTSNNASGDTGAAVKALSAAGTVERKGDATLWANVCPPGSTCTTVANDRGLSLTGDALFSALRKSSNFRLDINSMLDRMTNCLRDQIAAGSALSLQAPSASHTEKSVGRIPDDTCYDNTRDPQGYYDHYKDQVFVAACTTGSCLNVTVDAAASSCAGTLLFAGQRSATQSRSDATERNTVANYLEDDNLGIVTATDNNRTSFTTQGQTDFAGPGLFARVTTTQPAHQDIVRCIPTGASLSEAPSALAPADDLIRYNPTTRTLTLGRQDVESDKGFPASALFGCAWTPETRASGSGFRSYFKFNISDPGDGFVFAAIDGDRNGTNVCGAGEQHLGYSGNNDYTQFIAYPKLGLEFDTRRNYQSNPPFVPDGFNPARTTSSGPLALRTLANGRADPNYAGGHIGLTYWGGESPISTGYACVVNADCLSPSFCDTDNICKLNQEEDDNVHGQLPVAPAVRPPPANAVAPAVPPTNPPYPPYAVDKLDPSLGSVPTGQDIHVRVEVVRSAYAGRDDNSRMVRLVASSNLATLAGLPSIDSVALQAGDTLLVAGQTDARQNGVYVAASGTWARSTSADEAADLPPGTAWFIKEGTAYRGSLWRLQNIDAPIVGISEISVQRVRDAVTAVATANLALSGLPTVDGVTLASGNRVLLTGQTDPKENGVYKAGAGAWARAAPEDTAAGLRDGSMWFVAGGSNAGTFWRLNGDAVPGTSNITIATATTNDLYSSILTTQVWKEGSNVQQIARMKITTRPMAQLDPVVRYGTCAASAPLCPTSNPVDQYCGGTEVDGFRYCYTGQQPKLYDSKKIFDIRSTTSCGSNVSCSGNQFCGIDNVCYQPAFRTTRLGFTNSQSTSDQEIDITDFFTTWLP
ncbi:MAG: hypothetical protein KJ787_11675 [Gammaproteobacteria bacterium]|nr:hypothetical protein [Gammaproteobacteria bacterium]MBU1646980.1 hypothetical protein [Gammaproteobacteria bacterium]MBU1972492.1 hypothetical protein [Gammaproteobacteria bacterium]